MEVLNLKVGRWLQVAIKKELAPKGLSFGVSDFRVSDKFATILTVLSYPKYISAGYLSSLTAGMAGVKIVVKHIPVAFEVVSKMLNKQLIDLYDRYQKESDATYQERIRQDYESLENFIKVITTNQSKVFDFQMHIMITADTKEELERKKISLKSTLEAMEMRAIPLRF